MILRALIFICAMTVILGGSCWYLARRSTTLLPPLQRAPWAVYAFFALFVLLMFGVPLVHRLAPTLDRALVAFYWLGYLLFGFVSTYFVYFLAADLLQALLRRFAGAPPVVGAWAAGAAIALAALSVLAGARTALQPVPVKEVRIPVPGLAPGLVGFRIVQISDLHLGPLVRWSQVEHLLEATNGLKPDLIAVTGDLVDGEADGVKGKARRLGALRSTHGTFFVTGNHEYYSGVGPWLKELRGMGWTVLQNEHRLLDHRGATLVVAGMPDPTDRTRKGGGPDLDRTLAGAPPGALKVLLFHPPTGTEAAAKAGVTLQLSGHTHGGQYFPWSLLVRRLWTYSQGLHRAGPMWIYTSVGTGFWGPPLRLGVPPELTLLVLDRP